MYSGSTIRTKSGRIMGVHQKIDRVARRHMVRRVPVPKSFPTIKEILHFEGAHGPDGIKRKSPGRDEPWHFIDPNESLATTQLGTHINDHIKNMSMALRENNRERAAFEAAWLAHAVVDGLTPAHHYPLEEKLLELRGEAMASRNSARKKLVITAATPKQTLKNNWEFWGNKGVMTTHIHFEFGVASAISTMRFDHFSLSDDFIQRARTVDFSLIFDEAMRSISQMKMYEEFTESGWNRHLANETKNILVPEIIRTVIAAWTVAVTKAETI